MAEFKIDKKMLKKKVKLSPYAIVCGSVLLIYSLVILFPLLWGLMNTFKHAEQFDYFPNAWPDFSLFQNKATVYKYPNGEYMHSIFSNYAIVLYNLNYINKTSFYTGIFTQSLVQKDFALGYVRGDGSFQSTGFCTILIFLWNTVLTCFAGSILPIMLCCIMSYMCSKYRYKFSTFIYSLVVFVMACPVVGRQASMLSMQKRFGFYDNMFGFMLFNANFDSMYFLIFFAFFQGLPDSYMEAAEIDGASQFRVLTTIAIPLAGTIISASFVMIVISCWNDYNTPLVYLPTHPTIAYGIYYNTRMNTRLDFPPIVISTSMYLIIPATIFFLCLRKRLMGNLSLGGLKG